jgi:hypothetical protein
MKRLLSLLCSISFLVVQGQDTAALPHVDTSRLMPADTVSATDPLRIINLNPYFTLHVDSVLQYDFQINKPIEQYYWYLKNAPVGLKLDRKTGELYFKAEKSFFKSGKLKYDVPYIVQLGVQNLYDPSDNVDSSITILFYNTEIIPSRVKPTVSGTLQVEEGDSIRFRVQCETGSFPIEQITMLTNIAISNYNAVQRCDDEFQWMVPFEFIRDGDTAKQRPLIISFVASDKFQNKDTSIVRINVRPGIDYPKQNLNHKRLSEETSGYIANLKLTFYVLSASVKKNKSTRTTFDITGSTTALAGTVMATAAESQSAKDIGKILPSVGLTLVPVKEAVAPNKVQEQNTATQVRTVVRRLEYLLSENQLIGDRDPEILVKTRKLQEELKQARLQLVDLPMVEFDERISKEDAEKYFYDPKVNKKYKFKVN